MKKLCCVLLVVFICVGIFGCQKYSYDTIPPLAAGEKEVITVEDGSVYGKVVAKIATNVLVIELDSCHVEEWSEIAYVTTENAGKFDIGHSVRVEFSSAVRPYDRDKGTRIVADNVAGDDRAAKPIIYFYPENPTICSAKVTSNGELTCTYPEHGNDGWKDFTAYPDGTLIFPDGKEYYALYWEGIQFADWDFSKGFCVRGEDTAEFLEWALDAQGLTRREANEFIVYWLPLMQENPYNVISFQTSAYTDIAALDITPAPDSLLRVFMTYYPVDHEVEIAPQTFAEFTREGFTVVEWGGSEITTP